MELKQMNTNKIFNLKKEHLDIQYKNLEKRRNEINQSEYYFSLVEFANDSKRLDMIKAEMAMPVNSNKRTMIKSKFNKPNINLTNYQHVLREADDYIIGENDVIRGIMRKMDSKFQNKMISQKKKKTIIKRCTFNDIQMNSHNNSNIFYKPMKTQLTISTYSNPHKSYFTRTLNRELYDVLQKATSEETTFLKTQEGLNRTRRERNALTFSINKNRQDSHDNSDTHYETNSLSRKNYFHNNNVTFYTKKLLKTFPIISKMKAEEDLFKNTKNKLYMNYKCGLPLQVEKRKSSVDNYDSNEDYSEEEKDGKSKH